MGASAPPPARPVAPRLALGKVVAESLPPLAAAAACAYAVAAVLSAVRHRTLDVGAVFVALALVHVAFWLAYRRRGVLPHLAHPFAAGLFAMALFAITWSALLVDSSQTGIYIAFATAASGLLFLDSRWLAGVLAATLATTALVALARPDTFSLAVALTNLVPALAVAVAMHIVRRRTNERYERLRFEDTVRHRILERQRAELRAAVHQVTESEERYRAVFEGVPVGIYRTSPEGRILEVNPTGAALLGFPDRAAALGSTVTPLYVDQADRERWSQAIEAAGNVHGWELCVARPDGTKVWLRDSARAIRDASGRTLWYEGIIEDVTARKEAEAQLEEARRQMVQNEKLTALGTLVAGVAHEINNPLTYMRGSTELLDLSLDELAARADMPADARAVLQEGRSMGASVLRGIERVAQITASLKQVARAPSTAREPRDVNAIVESVVTVAASRVKDSAQMELDLRATRPVMASAPEISQVLLNLVFNASEALEGRADGRIRIRTRDAPQGVLIEVADNGPGIPLDEQPKIFVPFHTTKPSGTGLGLSVSHGIVSSHGGRISFVSTKGAGAVFRIELPAAVQRVPLARVQEAGFEPANR